MELVINTEKIKRYSLQLKKEIEEVEEELAKVPEEEWQNAFKPIAPRYRHNTIVDSEAYYPNYLDN